MPNREVYITHTAHFLPNNAIDNAEIEDYLGVIDGKPSKSRRIVLRSNGITKRYYALDKKGKATHTNAEMAALAIRQLCNNDNSILQKIQLLAAATSTPDQMLPSHAVMVHGWLPETNNIEVISPSGACCSGMHALKYAYLAIKSGEYDCAVSAGSERASGLMKANMFDKEAANLALLEQNPYIGFEKEFLRWMLSDGAGAFMLSNTPSKGSTNLKIEWIDAISFANQVETCMYMASDKTVDGTLKSYTEFSLDEIVNLSIFSMKQDVKLLSENIVALGFDHLAKCLEKRNFDVNDIDYFLPHLSSEFFRDKIAERLSNNNKSIPTEKWFTNLTSKGNTGAASIYIMLDELVKSGKLNSGQKILLAVPESARFSYVFCLLTVV
jgi:3-oxoacyl-[acyl-carrier-protein] synthase-3